MPTTAPFLEELTYCLLFAASVAVVATVGYILGKAAGYKDGFHTAHRAQAGGSYDTGCYSAFVSAKVFAKRMQHLPDGEWRQRMEKHLDRCINGLEERVVKEQQAASRKQQ